MSNVQLDDPGMTVGRGRRRKLESVGAETTCAILLRWRHLVNAYEVTAGV